MSIPDCLPIPLLPGALFIDPVPGHLSIFRSWDSHHPMEPLLSVLFSFRWTSPSHTPGCKVSLSGLSSCYFSLSPAYHPSSPGHWAWPFGQWFFLQSSTSHLSPLSHRSWAYSQGDFLPGTVTHTGPPSHWSWLPYQKMLLAQPTRPQILATQLTKTASVLWANSVFKRQDAVLSNISSNITYEHKMEIHYAPSMSCWSCYPLALFWRQQRVWARSSKMRSSIKLSPLRGDLCNPPGQDSSGLMVLPGRGH